MIFDCTAKQFSDFYCDRQAVNKASIGHPLAKTVISESKNWIDPKRHKMVKDSPD
jgi:hypothetical protein